MKAGLLFVFVLMFAGFSGYAQSLSGKEIFSGNCTACHSIGGGDIVGPDLAGITERREADWIKSFISNSQKMVAEGDKVAVELFNKYNKIAMPSHNFSEEELNNLISYMGEAGKEAGAEKSAEVAAAPTETAKGTKVALADTNGPGIYVTILLTCLGIIALLLSVIAGFLFRLLKS